MISKAKGNRKFKEFCNEKKEEEIYQSNLFFEQWHLLVLPHFKLPSSPLAENFLLLLPDVVVVVVDGPIK